MATATQLSIDEYLSTNYRPDCDYIDGELQERNVGKQDHSDIQRILVGLLYAHELEWQVIGMPEQRLRVSPTRVRIPDVCILPAGEQVEQIVTHPPLACIEILSESDSLASTQPRLQDYANFGVANIWVFDPARRQAFIWTPSTLAIPTNLLTISTTPVALDVPAVFARFAIRR